MKASNQLIMTGIAIGIAFCLLINIIVDATTPDPITKDQLYNTICNTLTKSGYPCFVDDNGPHLTHPR